ncbi:MAG: nuclear transport factor 2 family protein, partial [Gammaproteobacteria bacterium]|nr:nuclear transport factor 2 family protein [Gammaproteobacteria bacterium]
MNDQRPPLPPFTQETATQKVRLAEDAWNSRDPEKVSQAYTPSSRWRNRDEFVQGRDAIVQFLRRKWDRELDYRLIKELWAFTGNRIAVRFAYEWHDDAGNWFRAYGNENW